MRGKRVLFVFRAVCLILMALGVLQVVQSNLEQRRFRRETERMEQLLQGALPPQLLGEYPEGGAIGAILVRADGGSGRLVPELLAGQEPGAAGAKPSAAEKTEGGFAEALSNPGEEDVPSGSFVPQKHYMAFRAVNPDFVGWLYVEGTKIDYPVVRCEDEEYYLSHNFFGEESRRGCPFVKGGVDVETPGTNFIIYGHDRKDGSMFGPLAEFEDEDFYREHHRIFFGTRKEERVYEIMAVCRAQVLAVDDPSFKYYEFYQADSGEEFQYFYENIQKLALYDTGVEAEYGDTFLTLSTCAYHVKNGRLVVVAKRVQ